MPSSSRTSVWSDEGTEIAHEKDNVTVVEEKNRDEGPLIDFGEDDEDKVGDVGEYGEVTPGDKLRMLLSQMDAEIRQSTPSIPRIVTPPAIEKEKLHWSLKEGMGGEGRYGWRDGRRRAFENVGERSRSPSPPASPEREEESPPTPPPRINRAYIHPTRKTSAEREVSDLTTLRSLAQSIDSHYRSQNAYSTCKDCADTFPSCSFAC